MEVVVPKGKYIVAVSGGVDSVVLLDMLSKIEDPRSTINLVVAHFDHGIRLHTAYHLRVKGPNLDKALLRKLHETHGTLFYEK
jgi:tRNA(Ile)-lysidine synthase TilS/MesJ